MGPSNRFSWETGSFFRHCNHHRFLQTEAMRLYFPQRWNPRLCSLSWAGIAHSLVVPPGFYLQGNVAPPGLPATSSLHIHSAPLLPVSAPPTSLDESFLFSSLVVRLPYGLTFWQFWLFLFLIGCYPPFSCRRRLSMSTYASILSGSYFRFFFNGQEIWIDALLKKIFKWPINIWKYISHQENATSIHNAVSPE